MSLARFFPELRSLDRQFQDPFFKDFQQRVPAVDLKETKTEYIVKANVPGFTKDQIEIDADGSTLTIKGHVEVTKEENPDVYHHHKEISHSSFQRSFTLPMDIPADKIKASMADGVLNLTIPKAVSQPKKIKIN